FSDSAPWTLEIAQACVKHGLTPVLCRAEDVRAFFKMPSFARKLAFHLKFNTGMNRLGIPPEESAQVGRTLMRAKEKGLLTSFGVCTHFAMAEESRSPLTLSQISRFKSIVSEFSSLPVSHIHCAN